MLSWVVQLPCSGCPNCESYQFFVCFIKVIIWNHWIINVYLYINYQNVFFLSFPGQPFFILIFFIKVFFFRALLASQQDWRESPQKTSPASHFPRFVWEKKQQQRIWFEILQWWVCNVQIRLSLSDDSAKYSLLNLLENKRKHLQFYVLLINIDILMWKIWKYVSLCVSSLCYGTHSVFVVHYILQSRVTSEYSFVTMIQILKIGGKSNILC